MKFSTVLATLAPVAFVAATDYTVSVGDGGLTFNPNQITGAAQGDTINFQFKAKNHTVTQSTFASPCTQNGIDSGFMPVAANATQIPQFSVTVQNASAPLWFFCKQTSHCQQGMVFAVNPTPAKTFAMFQAMAMGQTAAANGTTGGTSAGSSGTGTAAGGAGATGSGSSAAPSATGKSGALPKLSFSSSAALLTVAGLVAGLSL
ncbi:hypothetical protein BD410DRAFT_785805 [Rickenella mellea]|uniref:Cupredoxin n=1 Tax=Rickenella mellea TaxID=50990 RepID=A0A4Y7QD76_9AGAM|nr:hypothetical protein BD410DRAFT_785805 [Rickenella mellea]